MPLTSSEAAYLAGIIDGEGSIMLQRSGGTIFVVVKVANTSQGLMAWLTQKTGVGRVQYTSRSHLGRKDVHHWVVVGRQALALLHAIDPYLIVKREQANVAFALEAENDAATSLAGRPFGRGNGVPGWLRHFREALYWHLRPRAFADEVRYHLARM